MFDFNYCLNDNCHNGIIRMDDPMNYGVRVDSFYNFTPISYNKKFKKEESAVVFDEVSGVYQIEKYGNVYIVASSVYPINLYLGYADENDHMVIETSLILTESIFLELINGLPDRLMRIIDPFGLFVKGVSTVRS